MSWEAVTWANKQKLRKSYEQIVLLVLANCADPNGEAFVKWPGKEHWWIYLSERTRLPKSSLFRHLNTLVALGLGERTMQVLADGSRRPTFKLIMTASFDIDLPEDQQRYDAAFAKASPENQSPVGTGEDDPGEHDENDSDISHSQTALSPAGFQSPVGTGIVPSQSPVGTDPFPVLGLHKDSLTVPKDSPLPPSGGASAVEELWNDFVRSWGEPIQRMALAKAEWDRTATDQRPRLIAAARGLWAYRKASNSRKEAPSAQSFIRDRIGWDQWLRYTPSDDAATVSIVGRYPLASREGRAICRLYEVAGLSHALRSFMIRDGHVSYSHPLTEQILALGADDFPKPEAWKKLSHQGAGSWNALFRETISVQTRRPLVEGALAPWPFAPSSTGKIYSTGPPDTLMSEQDMADFKG